MVNDKAAKKASTHPGDIRRVISQGSSSKANSGPPPPKPNTSRKANMAEFGAETTPLTYHVHKRTTSLNGKWGALIDRGAKGRIASRDIRIITKLGRKIDLTQLLPLTHEHYQYAFSSMYRACV